MSPTLGYWDLRGLAEPIRYLLHYKGVNFEDKRYRSLDTWTADKFSLGLDFPNLPYYIDGDVKITQSTAILRYLARKHGLAGNNDDERLRVDVAEQQIADFRMNLIRTCISQDMEKVKPDFVKSVPAQLKLWTTFLGDKKYLTGDSITFVDFMAYDTLDFYELFVPGIYKDFPAIKNYQTRFESLPELQSYFKSGVYKRWPIFGPMALFGYHGEEPKKV